MTTASPDWLRPGTGDSEPQDRHRLAVVAAHRDLTAPGDQRNGVRSRQDQQRARIAELAAARLDADQPQRIA